MSKAKREAFDYQEQQFRKFLERDINHLPPEEQKELNAWHDSLDDKLKHTQEHTHENR